MNILCKFAGLSHRERLRNSVVQERFRLKPLLLHIERSQLMWFMHLIRMLSVMLSPHILWGEGPEVDPRTCWRDSISHLVWEYLFPGIRWRKWQGRGRSELLIRVPWLLPMELVPRKVEENALMCSCIYFVHINAHKSKCCVVLHTIFFFLISVYNSMTKLLEPA